MSQRRCCTSQSTSVASAASPSIDTCGRSPAASRAISSAGLAASMRRLRSAGSDATDGSAGFEPRHSSSPAGVIRNASTGGGGSKVGH